jgi:hypothetical protein
LENQENPDWILLGVSIETNLPDWSADRFEMTSDENGLSPAFDFEGMSLPLGRSFDRSVRVWSQPNSDSGHRGAVCHRPDRFCDCAKKNSRLNRAIDDLFLPKPGATASST